MRSVSTGKRDAAEAEVVETLEDGGAVVVRHSGKDEPDLFVLFRGTWRPVEAKTSNGKLSPGQVHWWREVARTEPVVARTPAQARKLLRLWAERSPRPGDHPRPAEDSTLHPVGGGSWAALESTEEDAA
jgi:hypothetical protein